MQIIIENNDIKNMDSKVLANILTLIANGSAAPAENDLLAKEVAATETDVVTVPAEEVAEGKAEDIIKVEEPAPAEEAKKPVKKANSISRSQLSKVSRYRTLILLSLIGKQQFLQKG